MDSTHRHDETSSENRDTRDDRENLPRIAALSDLDDYEVADDYPDPRGWDVMTPDGTRVGEVDDLIVDTAEMRTRYLVVSLDDDAFDLDDDRDVLIPVGVARVDDGDDHVILGEEMTRERLLALPEYDHDELSREHESSLLSNFADYPATSQNAGDAQGADFYNAPHFDDRRFFGSNRGRRETEEQLRDTRQENLRSERDENEKRITLAEEELDVSKRRVQAGEVAVRKHVETEHVSQPVTTRREEVTIQRRRVDSRNASATDIGEDEIVIPVVEEEVVVEKRPVVKEEIVVTKQAVEDTRNVEADLRRERADIDKKGRVDGGRAESGRSGRNEGRDEGRAR
jgi:uncharacterized protein (TIGR02271 family)